MNNLSTRIVQILSHDSSRPIGATLLTGPWGSGKTFIWHTEIAPELKKKGLQPIYVSLFGATGLDDIRSKLISAWISGMTKGTAPKKIFDGIDNLGLVSGVRALFKRFSGVDLSGIRIDLIPFMKEQSIICFDDLERSATNLDVVLGFINFLAEHKKSRILLIANEEHFKTGLGTVNSSLYDAYKEKVIWTALQYEPSPSVAFDVFLGDLSDGEIREKVKSQKNTVLDVFRSGHWKNLRTLQRVIRYLAEVFEKTKMGVPDELIRYLVAILIEDARTGLQDKEIYNWVRFRAYSYHSQKKIDELTGKDKLAFEFYSRYCDGNIFMGQSQALYDFVKNGLLDVEALDDELKPEEIDLPEDQVLLKQARHCSWFFTSDGEKQQFMQEIENLMRRDSPVTAQGILSLLGLYYDLSDVAKIPPSTDIVTIAEARLKRCAEQGDSSLNAPGALEFESDIQRKNVEPLLRFYQTQVERIRIDYKFNQIDLWFNGQDHRVGIPDLGYDKSLLLAAIDDKYLDKADSLVGTDPVLHHTYYSSILKGLHNTGGEVSSEVRQGAYERISKRLERLRSDSSLDHSGQIRINDLIKRIPASVDPSQRDPA